MSGGGEMLRLARLYVKARNEHKRKENILFILIRCDNV
jgi:hypothetical protein